MELAGYSPTGAWDLVSQIVNRMFATDCYHNMRGVAVERLDSGDRRSMAKGVIWATFATHQVMREYMKHSFHDHPSVAGEYTRFLVANAGISKVETALTAIERLNGLVKDLEGKIEQVEKKAIRASNKADEAEKLAKKKTSA